jgi:hypothetical protein
MADKNTQETKVSSGCSERMQEMMKNMMSRMGTSCCFGAATMTEMMARCCPVQGEKEGQAEKGDHDAPR